MPIKRTYAAFELVEKMVVDLDKLLEYQDLLDTDAVKKMLELKDELYSFLRMHGQHGKYFSLDWLLLWLYTCGRTYCGQGF